MTIARADRTFAITAAFVVAMALLQHAAYADSVDYNSYEQLFGEPVTTSATGKPQRVSEAPVNITIISSEQIERSGARTLPDVLKYVAGVDVSQYGMQNQTVSIRGYKSPLNPRVLVLLDGQQVYQDDYGMTVWSTIPVALDAILRIEIIKGPNAALYGFNAVSGVINIITKDPLRRPADAARIQGGTQSQLFGDAVASVGAAYRWAVRLGAQGYQSTEFDGDQAYIERIRPRSGTISIDGRYRVTPKLEWDTFGSMSSLDSVLFVDIGDYAPVAVRTNSLRTGIAWDSAIGDVRASVYRNEERVSNNFMFGADQYREDLLVANLCDLIKRGSHAVRIALEYRNNDAASLNTFRGHIGYQVAAASAMWEWTIGSHVRLTNAVRMDSLFLSYHGTPLAVPGIGTPVHDAQLFEPSFNSGLVITLDGQNSLLFSAARAVQLPSLFDFGFQYTVGPVYVGGDSSLSPSKVTNYEIDWQRTLPRLSGTMRVAAFVQHTDTTVGAPFGSGYQVFPTGSIVLMSRNFGDSDEIGGELELKGETPWGLRWNASYALSAIDDHSSALALLSGPSISYQRQTPVNTIIGGLGYRWNRFDLDIQARWQSRYQGLRAGAFGLVEVPVNVSNNLTMRVHAGYHVSRCVTASLTADQVNHRQMIMTSGVPVARQVYAGLRVSF